MSWLDDLKVGEEVAIMRPTGEPSLCPVTRITKTQIVVQENYDWHFRKSDGVLVGYRGDSPMHIEPATDELRRLEKRREDWEWVRGHTHRHVSDEQIAAVMNILKAADAAKGEQP